MSQDNISETDLLTLTTKGIEAKDCSNAGKFVVNAGSIVVPTMVSSASKSIIRLRKMLLETGVIGDKDGSLNFTENYAFESPSTAASVVMGRSANGRVEWKTAVGITLKQLQEELLE